VSVTRLLELRSGDSETLLAVEFQPLPGALREFSELHVARFGFEAPEAAPVIEAVRIEARSAPRLAASLRMPADEAGARLPARARVWFGEWREVPLIESGSMQGAVTGPALIVEPHSTVVLEPGWQAQRLSQGELLLERIAPADHA